MENNAQSSQALLHDDDGAGAGCVVLLQEDEKVCAPSSYLFQQRERKLRDSILYIFRSTKTSVSLPSLSKKFTTHSHSRQRGV